MKSVVCGAALVLLFHSRLYAQVDAGNELFDKGNYGEALAAYQKAGAEGNNAGVRNRVAMCLHMLNRLKEAESEYKASSRLDPNYPNPVSNLATLFYSQRKFNEAERQFRKAAELDPENPVVRRNLRAGKFSRENGRLARQIADKLAVERPLLIGQRTGDLLEVSLLMPQDLIEKALASERRGDSFLTRKMYDDAIIEYRKAIAVDRYNASVMNRLGLAYHQSQKLRDAETYYREALKLNPFYIEALNNLGSVEYVRKAYPKALDQYNKALKIRPESATVLQNVGACLFAMERYEEGFEVYRRALRIDPKLFQHNSSFGTLIQTAQRSDSMLNFYMAKVFAEQGDKDRALSYLFKAVEEGFKDLAKLKSEPAFSILADDERFARLMAQLSPSW